MNVVSADNAPWVISSGDPVATLEIVLQRQTVVLSWHQFVYAEGDSKQVRMAFASHAVVINGGGLIRSWPQSPHIGLFRCARAFAPSVSPPKRRGSSMKSLCEGSRVSYEANVRDVGFRVAF